MRVVPVAMAAVLALTAAACDGKPDPTGSPAPPASSPAASASARPTPTTAALSDRRVAVAYLKATWSGGYRDHGAGSWLPRVRPYVTPAFYARLRRLHSGSTGGGVAWMDIKKYRLTPRFRLSGTRIRQKQPSGPKTHFVEVVFAVAYVTRSGGRPSPMVRLDTDLPTTKKLLRLDRTAAGWRVTDDEVGDGTGAGG